MIEEMQRFALHNQIWHFVLKLEDPTRFSVNFSRVSSTLLWIFGHRMLDMASRRKKHSVSESTLGAVLQVKKEASLSLSV